MTARQLLIHQVAVMFGSMAALATGFALYGTTGFIIAVVVIILAPVFYGIFIAE